MSVLIVDVAQFLIIPICLVGVVYWLKVSADDKKWLALYWVVAGVIGVIVTKTAGALIYDPRPFVVHHVTPLFYHVPDNGFPSDHTVLTTIVALTIAQRSRPMGAVLMALALVLGSARVVARVHSPLDIAGGVALGLIAVVAARPITDRGIAWLSERLGRRGRREESGIEG